MDKNKSKKKSLLVVNRPKEKIEKKTKSFGQKICSLIKVCRKKIEKKKIKSFGGKRFL